MSQLQQDLPTHPSPSPADVEPELNLRQELGWFFSSQEAFLQLSLVPKAAPPSSSLLAGARHTFLPSPLPQFPREVRRLPALTLLAAGRLGRQEQPQEQAEEAAGRHGGRQGTRRSSRAPRLGTPPSHRNERLVNYQTG